MNLSGHWVTANGHRRYVAPVPETPVPAGPDLFEQAVADLKVALRGRKKRKPKRTLGPDFSAIRNYHLAAHRELLEKRAKGIYDTPVLTPYALGLVREKDHDPGDIATPGISRNDGVMMRLPSWMADSSPFHQCYAYGSALAAANPSRPCDHSGFH